MSDETTVPNGKPQDDVPVFRLNRKRKRIKLEDQETEPGEVPCQVPPGTYVLKELSGAERDEYVTETINRTTRNPQTGAVVGYNPKDLEAKLVCLCAYTEDGKQIPWQKWRTVPSETLTLLYLECERLNGLDRVGREQVKKD